MIHVSSKANHIHRLQIPGLSNKFYCELFVKGCQKRTPPPAALAQESLLPGRWSPARCPTELGSLPRLGMWLPLSLLRAHPAGKLSTAPRCTGHTQRQRCLQQHRRVGLTSGMSTESPVPSGREGRSLMQAHIHTYVTLPPHRSPTHQLVHVSACCRHTHTLIPGEPHTCRCPQIPAQTLHPHDTPVQTLGLLLTGESSLEFNGE